MLERLDSYAQVRVGDFFQTRENNHPTLARVCETTPDCFYYCYKKPNGSQFSRGVSGDQLDDVVLIRKGRERLTVLAGRSAYDTLQKRPLRTASNKAITTGPSDDSLD